jgi:hypothetical protein
MQPSSTSHPDPDDVLAYVDGDATPAVAAHIEGCDVCVQQADALEATQAGLTRLLYRFDCPKPLTLGEYALDLLDPEQRQQTAAHTLECEACAAELHEVRAYLAAEAPFREDVTGRIRRLVATLLSPAAGPRPLAAAALRGAADSAARVYQADDLTISLSSGDGPGHLLGVLIATSPEQTPPDGGQARLVASGGQTVASGPIDDLGNFEFEGLAPGVYLLELQMADALVIVEGLQVR